jgi:DNA-binding transcriptional LysR family regulator
VEHLSANSQPFMQAPALAVLPRGHSLAKQTRVSLDQLRDEPLVMLPTTSLLRRLIDGKFAEKGRAPTIVAETSTLLSACQMVAYGLGTTVADAFTVRAVAHLGLTVRPLRPELPITFGFLLPAERPPPPMVARFMTIVAETTEELLNRRTGLRSRPPARSGRVPTS